MQTLSYKKKTLVQSLLLASMTGWVAGCFNVDDEGNVTSSTHYAVISTQSSDFKSGDISLISLDDYSADNTNYGGLSDVSISTDGENVYRIGRLGTDNVTKFHIDSISTDGVLWQFSTNAGDEEKSNPYKLVVKNENTAYIIRYGLSTIWIVDPSVSGDASIGRFKTGEIDLSSYTEGENDLTPEATDALLIDNKLYVLLQNFDQTTSPWSTGIAYIAVFDTENEHAEIETNTDNTTPKGIQLKVTNPAKMEYLSTNNSLYVAGQGFGGASWTSPPLLPDYAGGIEKVEVSDYSTSLVVDDGDSTSAPYGRMVNVAILSSTRGYFVGSRSWKDTDLYHFNPTTGVVDTPALMENKDISDIEIGPLGNLWVTDRAETNPGIVIFETVNNTVFKDLIGTDLQPNDIEFISVK